MPTPAPAPSGRATASVRDDGVGSPCARGCRNVWRSAGGDASPARVIGPASRRRRRAAMTTRGESTMATSDATRGLLQRAPDRDEIVRVAQFYIDGFNDSSVDKLKQAFHQN